jgi:hypothetical protein
MKHIYLKLTKAQYNVLLASLQYIRMPTGTPTLEPIAPGLFIQHTPTVPLTQADRDGINYITHMVQMATFEEK